MLNRATRRKHKIDAAPLPAPREIDEIQKEYAQVSSQYANSSYQAELYAGEAQRLFGLMKSLNEEAGARQKLDAEKPKVEAKDE